MEQFSVRRLSAAAHRQGFTAVEMLVVLALASILALYAIPSLQSTVANNRADTLANQLLASLSLARSEAVKLGQNIYVNSLTPSAAAPYNWGGGWCVSTNSTCAASAAANIQGGAPVPQPTTVYASNFQAVFDPTGRLVGQSEVDFVVCADGATVNTPKAQGVTVVASGRARIAYAASSGPPQKTINATPFNSCTTP